MNFLLKLDLHKTLFGSVASYKSDSYSMKCVDLAVADFSPVMAMDALLSRSTKPFDLFSKEEEVLCLLEFAPGVTVEEENEPELNTDHTAIDMKVDKQEASSSNTLVETCSAGVEQEDEEKKNRDLVDAAMAVLFPNGERNSRRKYTPEDIRYVIEMRFIKNQIVTDIMKVSKINAGTARGYIRDVRHIFEDPSSTVTNDTHKKLITIQRMDNSPSLPRPVPAPAPRGNQKLYQEHSRFLIEFFENNELATLDMARLALLKAFDLSMSRSGIHQHMRKKGCLVVKCLELQKVASVTKPKPEDKFCHDGVFVGAVDLLMYIRESFGWRRGEPLSAVHGGIIVPTLAAFSGAGVVNISIVSPVCVLQNSEGYKESILQRKVDVYAKFFAKCMDVMEKNESLGRAFIISDGDIFNDQSIHNMFEQREFKMVYRPISFENFWSKFKNEIGRQALNIDNPLFPRLCLASKAIGVKDCRQFIQQNITHE
jgi:hypothetical protein